MEKKDKQTADRFIKEIKRKTRRTFSSEQKIKIVLEGMRGEQPVAEMCRRYGIHENLYYKWCKDFMEAGKKQINGDSLREANTDDVSKLRLENDKLKGVVADLLLENTDLKKTLNGFK
jgi:transposase